MRIAILGFGREGKSILKFLKKSPKYKSSEISILDQKYGEDYLKNLSSFDLVFRSPGVPYNLKEIQNALKKGVKFSSVTKLFFDLCLAKIIGITGTKGKGATATLLYKILKSCGFEVLLGGNIGKPALELLPKINKKTMVILELSSFQLQDLERSPQIAVITDVFPDHLDSHKNMNEYLDAKSNICLRQKPSDAVFYFKDNLLSKKIAQKSSGMKIGIDGNPFGLKKNFVMASAIAAYLGCPNEKILKAVRNFKGVEHRMEFVAEKNRIRFYNDSAGTNPQTAAAAILSFNNPIILIAGGKDKNLDYKPLAETIKRSAKVKIVILIGENKNKIKKIIKNVVQVKFAADLNSSVKMAYKIAGAGEVVLFSPASASFDMFKDYKDRGKQFKKAVQSLR